MRGCYDEIIMDNVSVQLLQYIEERYGRMGRPITTALLSLVLLAIAATCLSVIYKNVIGPILEVAGLDAKQEVATLIIAWSTLVIFAGTAVFVILYLRRRWQESRRNTLGGGHMNDQSAWMWGRGR